jgi:hypothetical protein
LLRHGVLQLLFVASLGAQVAPSDTVPRVSSAPSDTATVPRDTIKDSFVVGEQPRTPEARGRQWVWDRQQIYVTGATSLAELIQEVPGASIVRSSWLMSPVVTSWYGEPGRVRVFMDGVELDAIDPRMHGQLDLATIPLYGLEEVAVERAAGELRVHLRTWRVVSTTATTRVDVGAGSENFTMYRGYYGKRFQNGAGFQVAGQQFTVINGLTRGDGDSVGWARDMWSIDAVAMSTARNRTATRRYIRTTPEERAISSFDGSDRLGYLRVAYGNPDANGLWLQAIASSQQSLESDSIARNDSVPDPDTLISQTQYIATGGFTNGGLRLTGAARYRVRGGEARLSPSVRARWGTARLELSAAAELDGPDSTDRLNLGARLQPFRWLHLGAVATQHSNDFGDRTTARAEAGIELARRWVTVGMVQQSATNSIGMAVYDTAYTSRALPESQGMFVAFGGPIWGPFSVEAHAIDWGDEQFYRPKVVSRAALKLETGFERWLKRGKFVLTSSLVHDYRSDMLTPNGIGGVASAKGTGALSLLVDVRLGDAHIFFHNRNFTGEVYETVPGYLMPRMIQQYGVRWVFWN